MAPCSLLSTHAFTPSWYGLHSSARHPVRLVFVLDVGANTLAPQAGHGLSRAEFNRAIDNNTPILTEEALFSLVTARTIDVVPSSL